MEAVLLVELTLPTSCTSHFIEKSEVELKANIDLINEVRARVHLRNLAYKRALAKTFNIKVCPRRLKKEDLVLIKAEVNDPTHNRSKLAPT